MADVNANIGVNIDTSEALAQLKALQRQISQFHTSVAKSSEAAGLAQRDLQKNFINSVNATGAFSAELRTVKTTSESFTNSLEKNKFSMREYFRYSAASTKTFGQLFKSEFDTIGKVAEDRVKKLQTQYIKLGRDSSGAMKAIAVMPNQLDMNNFSTQTQLAAQKQAIFNQLVKQGSTNLLNFGKNTQWAGRQLMVGFTLPLASLGMVASRTFMEMEAQTIKFRKVYGDLFTPTEETDQALDSITALGQMFTKYGVAVSQTVGLAAEAAAAGFSGLDLQRQTTEATRLSVLGQLDAQKALETTISLQNAFKMSSENLAESIDFLNAVENQTVVSLDDITTAIPKVAPVIQQLGGDVKDLAFFMAAMKEGGINASEGANALKSGLASLINPSTKAAAMLESVGVNIKKIVESNQGDLKATVVEFAQALDTLDPLTRARAIEQLFGKFQFARLSTLFDNVTNETGQAARVLELAGSSIEDLASLSEKELGLTADSAMNKFRKSVEDLKLALVPVGQTFLEAVTPIVEFIGGILEKFNNLSSGVKRALVILTVAVGAIGPIALMTFGLLANGLANILKGVMVLRNGYLKLTGQSQILGEQTDYLTMEQIDAAAAAHSLDQSHARLTQTFTAESTAIAKLIASYQQAANAGAKFAAINPGMMMAPRTPTKRAEGKPVVVGGTGNKDTELALLTPGETVIPAKMSKKYAALINGMIAGNIPGYMSGKSAAYAHAQMPFAPGSEQYSQGIKIAGLEQLSKEFPQFIKVVSNLVAELPQALNVAMKKGAPIGEFTRDYSAREGKFTTAAKLGGLDLGDEGAKIALQSLENEIGEATVQLAKQKASGAEVVVSDEMFAEATRSVINKYKDVEGSAGKAARALDKASTQIGQIRVSAKKDDIVSGLASGKFRRSRTGKQTQNQILFDNVNVGRESSTNPNNFYSGNPTSPRGSYRGKTKESILIQAQADAEIYEKTIKQKTSDIYVSSRERQSPHPQAAKDGADDARAYDKARSAVAQQSRSSLYGSGPIDPVQKAIRRNEDRKMRLSQVGQGMSPSPRIIQAIDDEVAARKSSQQRLSSMNSALMGGTFALTSLAGAGSMASGPLGDISRQVMKFSGLLFGLMSVTQLLTQAKVAELVATRVGVAKSTVANAVATGSSVIAGRAGILGTIGRVALGLKTFLGPIGLATTALSLAYIGFNKYNKAQEEARLRIEGLGRVAETTEKELKTLSDFFGFVPTARAGSNFRLSAVQTSENERTQIEELKKNEEFIKDYADEIKVIAAETNKEAMLSLATMQLDLAGRGAPKEAIKKIIIALAEEAGKTNLILDFKEIDIKTESGKASAVSAAKEITDSYNKALATGITKVPTFKPVGQGASIPGDTKTVLSPELQKQQASAGKNLSNILTGLGNSFKSASISAADYESTLSQIIGPTFLTQKNSKLLQLTLKAISPELAKAAAETKDYQVSLLLLRGALIGAAIPTSLVIDATKGWGKEANTAKNKILAIVTASEKFQKEIAGMVKGTDDLADSTKKTVNPLIAKIDAIVKQTRSYKILRNANIDNKTATELSNDAEIASLVILAAKNGTLPKTIALIEKLARVQKKQNDAAIKFQSPEEALKADTSRGLALIALGEKLIDIKFESAIKKETSALEEQESQLKSINDQIDNITRTEINPLKAQIDANNFALEGIALKEDAINKNYDTQISALDKIASINQEINNIQKQRMSIADAITRGDISAAAVAAQEARAQQAESAIGGERNALTAGRDAAIKALGRNALEQKNKELQYQISIIQNTQILNLEKLKTGVEDKIRLHESEILRLQKLVDQEKSQLTYVGKTKQELENFDDLIGFAEAAGIEFTAELLASATNAKSLAEYLQKVLEIQLKINAAKAGGLGGPGAPADTLTTQPEDVQAKIDNLAALKEKIEKKIGSNDKEIIPPKELTTAQQKTLTLAKQDAAMAGRAADAAKAVAAAKASTANTLAKQEAAMVARAPLSTAAKQDAAMAGRAPVKRSMGGLIPKYMAAGGFARGTDTVPAMLTPGEFVVKKFAVDSFGVDNLRDINNGTFNNKSKADGNTSSSVYNYGINVNVANSNASTDEIARAVITQIKNIDNQRIRSQRY
jgi:TP901 family phage tail tape measure protein